jgi:hypothetical protein
MWKNIVQPAWLHITIKYGLCTLHPGWLRLHDTHSECVILIAFLQEQWLCRHASVLHLYLYCLSCIDYLHMWCYEAYFPCRCLCSAFKLRSHTEPNNSFVQESLKSWYLVESAFHLSKNWEIITCSEEPATGSLSELLQCSLFPFILLL